MPPKYRDLFHLSEDERVVAIAEEAIRNHGKIVGFLVDGDNYDRGKADRYIKKLNEKYPQITILDKSPGPVKDTVLIRVSITD